MTETQILGFATHNAPNSRTTAGNERFELLAMEATYDGTAAAGDFVPAVQIVSDAGVVVGTFPLASPLAPGDSATITWAPFLRNGVGLTGIYYDFANIGDYLNVEATGHSPTAFTVGGESSNWSIGLDGDAVALGGTTQAWLVSPNLVELSSPGGSILNDAGAAGDWQVNTGTAEITAQSSITFTEHGSGINFTSTNAATGQFQVIAPFFFFQTSGATWRQLDSGQITWTGSDASFDFGTGWAASAQAMTFTITLAGSSLEVQDHTGAPIFRINEDGSLQGKTGKSLVFNL